MSGLTLDKFNNILFGAFKEQSDENRLKLLQMEINMVEDVLMDHIGNLLDELNEAEYKSETFQTIKNIKNNTEGLIEEYYELRKKLGKEDE